MSLSIFVNCHKDYENVGITNPVYKLISPNDIKNNSNLELIRSDNLLDNRLWSELSNMYYVYSNKDLQTDYIGFCHYRRYFDFMNDIPNLDKPIIPNVINSNFNNYINYDICHNSGDLLSIFEIIEKKFKDYVPYYIKMLDSHNYIPYNMFVMSKDLFNEYSKFIFGVLFEFDSKIKVNNTYEEMLKRIGNHREKYIEKSMSPNNSYSYQARIFGFIAERLTTAFFLKYMNEHGKNSLIQKDINITEKTYNRI